MRAGRLALLLSGALSGSPVQAGPDFDQYVASLKEQALAAGKTVQVSVQSAFGCGFEGPIAEERVLEMVAAYLDAGLRNISLAFDAHYWAAQPQQALFSRL